jgi:hypothetical protein
MSELLLIHRFYTDEQSKRKSVYVMVGGDEADRQRVELNSSENEYVNQQNMKRQGNEERSDNEARGGRVWLMATAA